MVNPALATAAAGGLASSLIGLFPVAQVAEASPADRPALSKQLADDDVGLPEAGSPPDRGLPEAGSPPESGLPDGDIEVIPGDTSTTDASSNGVILVIDGKARYYVPADIENTRFSDSERVQIPTYVIPGEAAAGELNQPAPEASSTEESNDGFVIYPPADSVEDLEPEDILQDP